MINNTEKLRTYTRKTITKGELEDLFNTSSDEKIFHVIQQLESDGLLSPVKSSGTNGNKVYPVYLKYRITFSQNYDKELTEISKLHPLLQENGYLSSHPKYFEKYHDLIIKLDRYLFSTGSDPVAVSRKERSFEIFDEEKALDNKDFCRLLNNLGMNSDTLYFYDTPGYCFNDYIPERKEKMTLLICENKDIWFNIRRMMYENNARVIFDTFIDGVVCGWGNRVSEKNALTEYTAFMGAIEVDYLYWGDIDREGLNIYLKLIRNNPALNITLFSVAYSEMLELAQYKNIPRSNDKREFSADYSCIYDMFNLKYKAMLLQSIENNRRIPQEIISYSYLKNNMR